MNRIVGIDIFRGIAIVLMVIFHISYDLNYFHFYHIPLYSSKFWLNFRLVIVNIFLITVGMSLALAYKESFNFQKFKRRILILAMASLAITVATYIVFPNTWVYFGVIHYVLIATIAGIFFVNRPKLALFLSIAIIISYLFFGFNMHKIFKIVAPVLHLPMRHTEDLVPFIPWFSATLFGISIVGFNWHLKIFDNNLFNAESRVHKFLSFLGKHSLIIYLIHLPLLFGIFYLLAILWS